MGKKQKSNKTPLIIIGIIFALIIILVPTKQVAYTVEVSYDDDEPYTDYTTKTTSNTREITVASGSDSSEAIYSIPISVEKDGELFITASSSSSEVTYWFGINNEACKLDGLKPLVGGGSGTSYSRTYSNAIAGNIYCLLIIKKCDESDFQVCFEKFRETHNVRLRYKEYNTENNPITKYKTVTKYKTETRYKEVNWILG